MKRRAAVNDGNLSVHLRKLEEAGYTEIEKTYSGRKPQTLCRLSESGREAWIAYIDHIPKLLRERLRTLENDSWQGRKNRQEALGGIG